MTKPNTLNKILGFLKLSEEKEVVKLAEETLENGTILVAESFEAGQPVFIKGEGEEDINVPLPIGDYKLENGKILCVTVEGEIDSIKDSEESEEVKEDVQEEIQEESNENLNENDSEEEEEESNENEGEESGEEEEVEYTTQDLLLLITDMSKTIAELSEKVLALEEPGKVVENLSEETNEENLSEEDEEEVKFSPEANTVTKTKGIYFPKNSMNTTKDRVYAKINANKK